MYKKLMKKAKRLVDSLQDNITSGRTQICENYGQREIRRFIDKEIAPRSNELTYQEECSIKDVLYKVSSIC